MACSLFGLAQLRYCLVSYCQHCVFSSPLLCVCVFSVDSLKIVSFEESLHIQYFSRKTSGNYHSEYLQLDVDGRLLNTF